MHIMFNSLLIDAGLSLMEVRLVRHKDLRSAKGRSPYELWRDQRPKFELYQSTQSIANRKKFSAPYWAVFIVDLSGETMFAGLYGAKYKGLLSEDTPMLQMDGIHKAGSWDIYDLTLQEKFSDLIGKLYIDWGPGVLAWVQYANRQDKPIIELRKVFYESVSVDF